VREIPSIFPSCDTKRVTQYKPVGLILWNINWMSTNSHEPKTRGHYSDRRKTGRHHATAVAEFFDLAESCNASMGTSLPTFRLQRADLFLSVKMSKRSKKLLHRGKSLNSQSVVAVKLFWRWSACVAYGSQLHAVFT
jgi:hypothetical protein